ncbi:unnamed protein product, partial [Mesorhabditis belari]|uniref:Uncharacterized protein n=1 Tax=Mesorhabditis belari TaxID=2138241 RepID=A0AAF3J781_9BILA
MSKKLVFTGEKSRPNRVSARAVSVEPTNRDSMTYTRANFNSSTLTRSYNSSSTGNSNVSPYAAKSERYSSNDSLSNYRPPAPTYRSTGLSSVGRSSSLSGSNFSISSLRDRASSPSRDYERYKPPDRSYRDKEGTPTKSTLSLRERNSSTKALDKYRIENHVSSHTPYKSKDMKIDDTELESRFEQLYNKYVRDSDTSDNESVKSCEFTIYEVDETDPSDRAGSTTPTQEFFNKELTEMGTKTRKIYIKSRNSESPIKAVQASQASTEENGKIGKTTMKTFIKRSESPKFDAGKIDGICIKETGSTKSSGESKGFSLRKRIGRTLENLKDSILQKKISDTMESSITISDEEDQPSTSADYVSCIKDVNTIDDENDDLYTVATISMNGKQNTRGDSMSPVEWTTIQTLLPQKNEEEEGNQQRCRILIWPQPGHEMCPPMVMVTQPSQPNTPIGKVEFFAEESSGESTEEVESFSDESDDVYESDFEYSASETVSFALPIAIVTNGPAVVNDLSFLEQSHDLRGRVESFLAQPPPLPVFTCSVTYDGQLSGQEPDAWDSADEGDEEEERGPETLMSRLNGPERRSSDEESNYHGQTVGATLTLVQKAALKGEGEEDSDTAEYYESDEYSDETDFDEDEEFTTDSYDSQSDEGSFESEIESASMSFESASEQSDEPSQLQTAIEELPKVFDLEKMLVQSIVKEIDEEIEEAMLEDLPEEENPINPEIREVNEEKGETEVNMEPTYVKQSEEKVKEVTASRYFPEKQPATDFAKKAVIQPPKLEKARVATVETKMADSPKPKLQSTKVERKVQDELQFGSTLSKIMAAGKLSDGPKDKSSVRKSALNMTADEAKRKELENEEAAKKSARRYNLVGSLAEKFKEATEMPQEKITYRRSKALQSKEEERPRRKYAPIIQPVVDDSFDKQMEELREKMKAGTTAFQKEFTDLKKGMLTKAEEAKIKGQEDNHKKLLDQAAKVMGKADEEKRRQKGLRDAEIEKELAKNETRKVKKVKQQKDDAEDEEPKKSEPRRTVRRLKQDDEATTADGSKERKTSTVSPADKLAKPSLPKTQIVVNDDNLSILETAHAVATKKRSALDALRNRRSCGPDMSVAARGPAGDGAAATRIRNMALAVASNPPSARPRDGDLKTTPITVSTSQANNEESSRKARKYGQRRKTEEIILPPKEPTKPKRRRDYSRANRFIRKPGDIDMILGWEKEANKFENFERLFMTSENDRVKPQEAPPKKKSRRNAPTKIWISELTDIDKIYKTAELRDIIASAQG